MREDHRLGRVDAAGQIIDDNVVDVVGDVIRRIAVGDHLIVGDDDVRVYATVLKIDAPLKRTEVMTQVQPTRGTVSREHTVLSGIDVKIGANQITFALCRLEAAFIWHVGAAFLSKMSARWYTIWKTYG